MSTPQSGACLPPQGIMQFFPGLKGDKGDKGDPGPASTVVGPIGPAGGVGVYVGTYDPDTVYYSNEFRHDIVDYGGRFWITNDSSKNGTDDWDAPNVDDWADFGTSLVMVATALRLLQATNIAVGLNFQGAAYLKSDNFVQFVSGWLLAANGRVEAYDALIAGQFSTNSSKFNLESPTRTMPSVATVEFDIPAIADGDIPVNPAINNVTDDALIYFGWLRDPNTFLENRFGNEMQNFLINLEGTGENNAAGTDLFYIQLYYRLRDNGGAWDPWVVIGQDAYMQVLYGIGQSFQLTKTLKIALTGTQDIQFSAGFSKGVGGVALVNGAKISAQAYN